MGTFRVIGKGASALRPFVNAVKGVDGSIHDGGAVAVLDGEPEAITTPAPFLAHPSLSADGKRIAAAAGGEVAHDHVVEREGPVLACRGHAEAGRKCTGQPRVEIFRAGVGLHAGDAIAFGDAVRVRDIPVIQFLMLILATVYVLVNLIADVATRMAHRQHFGVTYYDRADGLRQFTLVSVTDFNVGHVASSYKGSGDAITATFTKKIPWEGDL